MATQARMETAMTPEIRPMGARAVRPNLTVDQAAAILATATSPEVVDRFTIEHEWSYDEVEAWLAHAMSTLLLRPGAARSSGSA
jgi:hypothetical protein